MPIIQFDPKDNLRAVKLQSGYYPLKLVSVDGPRQSNSGKSINIFAEFEVDEGHEFAGKVLKAAFSNGIENASILKGMYWMPMESFKSLICAIMKVPETQVMPQVDTDEVLQGKFDGKVELATDSEIGLFNIVKMFLPRGAAKANAF